MSITDMIESLQLRSQALPFARSLIDNKAVNKKEEGCNFEQTFRKPNTKVTANKSNKCALGVELSHIIEDPFFC